MKPLQAHMRKLIISQSFMVNAACSVKLAAAACCISKDSIVMISVEHRYRSLQIFEGFWYRVLVYQKASILMSSTMQAHLIPVEFHGVYILAQSILKTTTSFAVQ